MMPGVILFVLLASTSGTAAPVIVENTATHAVKVEAAKEHGASIRALSARDDAAGLSSILDRIDDDADIDPGVREHFVEATLLAMSGTTPDPVARATVNRFRHRPVRVFVRLHEESGNAVVPLYDPAAAAELTLRVWDTAAAEAQVSLTLDLALWQPGDFLQPLPGMSLGAWQDGTRRAFETADKHLIAASKPALLRSMIESADYAPLLLVAAARLSDIDLYAAIIARAETRYAREAIGSVFRHLHAGDATTLLINACARPALASAAILELGTRATEQREIRGWLLRRLGNPADGASAALALARAADDDILNDMQALILGEATELSKLRAALVLRLSGSAAALSLRRDLLSRTLPNRILREALQ